MPLTIHTEAPKSSRHYNLDPRVRAIDELQRIANDARDDFLGDNWSDEAKKFYALEGILGKSPSFRPSVQIPQLQVLSISEATDLTDSSPKVYIYNRTNGEVDHERSRAFQEQWKECWVNYHLMFAALWAQFCGVGFLQGGYDPFGDGGMGQIWCRHRDPSTVSVDSGATELERPGCTYLILEDRLYPDQIAYNWPETGTGLQAPGIEPGSRSPAIIPGLPSKLRFPEGPMRMASSPAETDEIQADGRLRVRYMFIDDRTIEIVREQAGGDSAAIVEQGQQQTNYGKVTKRLYYPNMRLIVAVSGSNGRIVADGDNPTPGGHFPVKVIYGLPPLDRFYPPPPIRYTKELQIFCERMLTQIFENTIRVNNGIWFIHKGTGINSETFGGLPGEVQIIDDNSQVPTFIAPKAMDPQVIQLITSMLNLQKELQGYSSSREGVPGAGNISPELFEASIYQSKRLTRCRARLLAKSVSSYANLQYDLMSAFYSAARAFPGPGSDGSFGVSTWKPAYGEAARHQRLYIDPVSLLPVSQAALRQLAPTLRQEGAIDVQTLLESLEIPDAAGIAKKLQTEQALAALAAIKRRR